MAMIHISRSGQSLGVFDEARVREGLGTGEFIGTDLGWTEGMSTWRPLSELETFGSQPPPVAPPAPAPTPEQPVAVVGSAPVETTGLPWENRDQLGWLNALIGTIGMVITRPGEAFTVMKREGGLGDALLFTIILGVAGLVASFGFAVVLPSLGLGAGGMGDLLGLGASAAFIAFAPVAMVLGIFIGGAIIHVCLMLLGGANRPFETTIRVLCYVGGSTNIFLLVPVCGSTITFIASLVLNCIGLARAHQTDTWRPVVAVILPIVVCCGGFTLLAVLVPALVADWN